MPTDPATRTSRSSNSGSTTLLNAIIGGVAGIVLSFIPLSTLLGGAISGYLDGGTPESGFKIGAIAGLIMFLPFAFLGFLLLSILGFIGVPAVFSFVGILILVASAAYTIGLSAIGGYVGVYIKNEF